ncbi:MAG: HAD family phosphatase [Gammaproteobacteria bacterium]|jgi:2-haloacid dehalogenase
MLDNKLIFKNVVFDLGGVLIDWNPRYLYRQLIPDEAKMEDFLGRVINEEWSKKEDIGQPLNETIREFSKEYPHEEHLIEAYQKRWPETLGSEIFETVAILKELKQNKINLYALTNWSCETFHHAKSRFAFLEDFLDIVVSGEEKVIKPDPEIYKILLNRNGLKAGETVFIDDRLVNVKGAEDIGMHGLHFTSPENLSLELKKLNLI